MSQWEPSEIRAEPDCPKELGEEPGRGEDKHRQKLQTLHSVLGPLRSLFRGLAGTASTCGRKKGREGGREEGREGERKEINYTGDWRLRDKRENRSLFHKLM
jgi:hypothetical protein